MAEETPAPETGVTPEGETPPETLDDLQSQIEAAVKKATSKANREAADLRHKLKEFEDRDKTDVQRQAEAVAALQKERDDAASQLLRYQVATDKSVPAPLVKFLPSGTREEMEAAADALLTELGERGKPRPPAPTSTQGKQTQGTPSEGDQFAAFLHSKF